MVDKNRIHSLNKTEAGPGLVVYWMSRDQRVQDNWALLCAQEIALEQKKPLAVVFSLVPRFLYATTRQYEFMLKGLEELEEALRGCNIPFHLLTGSSEDEVPKCIKKLDTGIVISDFAPLRIQRTWRDNIARSVDISMYEVDAHNIVPCRVATDKQEYGAYTIRPKIHRLLDTYLTDFPKLKKHPHNDAMPAHVDWKKARKTLKIDTGVGEVDWLKPGEKAASRMLDEFIEERLTGYADKRNDPNKKALSNLSPYLHFGQISAQRVALSVKSSRRKKESRDSFLEELIVRRELSDNFCFYNERYDSFEGFPAWAQKTLNEHRKDKRDYLYSVDDFEQAGTHDPLWNAAQIEMVDTGKMHGYMRMYWAKKILEWTENPEEALAVGIYLNDKYELDGRDPNGYVGVAWSIGGVHDRAWTERPVFGKIRYMNYNGAKRKFDVDAYVKKFQR
jgi:deoxyribodipyrimidine photo-lyase